MRRVFHRVQVIEVAEELIKPVDGRQELILVAKVILAELAGGITERFECSGNCASFSRRSYRCTGLADVVIPVRIGSSPVMKFARPAVQLASA